MGQDELWVVGQDEMMGHDENGHILILDLETRANPAIAEDPERLAAYREQLEPPKNYKDPLKIEAWRTEKLKTYCASLALYGHTGMVVVCCASNLKGSPLVEACTPERPTPDDEAHLLASVSQTLSAWPYENPPLLVGYNIRDFDLPYLIARCAIHGVPLPSWFPRPRDRYGVLDLYNDVFMDGTLADWMAAFGLPPKAVDGAALLDLPIAPDLLEHCKADVSATVAIVRQLRRVHPDLFPHPRFPRRTE